MKHIFKNGIAKRALALFMCVCLFLLTLQSSAVNLFAAPGDRDSNATVDHIDIAINMTAYITINGETMSAKVALEKSDYTSGNVTLSAVQYDAQGNATAFTAATSGTNIDTSSQFYMNTNNISTSDSASGEDQLRVSGTYPVGTPTYPVYYTLTLTKAVTFTSTTGATYTVTMTFSGTFNYWDSDNDCPGLRGNSTWYTTGTVVSGSGMDFVLGAQQDEGAITITKYVYDMNGDPIKAASGTEYTFTIYKSDGTVYQTVTIAVGESGIGATVLYVDSGSYYVTEETPADTISNTDYEYQLTTTMSSGTLTSTSTAGDYTTGSLDDEESSYTTVTLDANYSSSASYSFYNYYDDTIDLTVNKVWSDSGNAYKTRPDDVTVTLWQGGAATTQTVTLSESNNWSASFTGLDKTLSYSVVEESVDGYTTTYEYVKDSDGNITYTVTNTLNTGTLTLTKTVKDPDNAASETTFTFLVEGFDSDVTSVDGTVDGTAVSYSVSGGVATVNITEGTTVTLVLPVGTYTVTESGVTTDATTGVSTTTVNNYTWTVEGSGASAAVTAGQTVAVEITNTITGEATVVLTKEWDDQSNYWNTRPASITVTLTAVDADGAVYKDSAGNTYTYTVTATSSSATGENVWVFELSGVAAYDVDGNKLTYTVVETAVDGYTTTYSSDGITYSSDGELTPADNVNTTIKNTLKTASVTVEKVVKDSDGNVLTKADNSDNFRFVLYDDAQTSYGTVTLDAGDSYTFTNIPLGTYSLTEYLVGSHVHTYVTTATVDGTSQSVTENWIYDSTEDAYVRSHTVTFTLTESDNGATVSVVVTNQEEAISVDLGTLVKGTKTLKGDNATTKTFTYTVKEVSVVSGVETEGDVVATGSATVSTGSTEDITWTILDADAFTYTEVGTYYYVIYEDVATGTGTGGVTYDSTRYTLTIEVTKDEGDLVATASMTKNVETSDGSRSTTEVKSDTGNVTSFTAASSKSGFSSNDSFTAAFVNTYDATATSIILRASKSLTGRALKEGEFTIEIQQIDEDGNAIGSAVTRTNGATGQFGYEITYDTAGTYIYKVSEVKGTLSSVTYDGHYYIVYVYVADVDGVLTVTGTDVGYYDADGNAILGTYSFDAMTFTNTYTATGEMTLSTYKVLDGRDFNADDTFTFILEAMDANAPFAATYSTNSDGYRYIEVTVTGSQLTDLLTDSSTSAMALIDLLSLTLDQDDVGTWLYRVSEVVGTANGMTYDTQTYGHLITVTVTDNATGKLTVTTSSTNDTDWNGDGTADTSAAVIVNTFDQGSTNIYGAKVWVDGNKEHDNAAEVELTLYYSVDGGTTWKAWTEKTDGTYSIDGVGSYSVEWGTLNKQNWRILGLPEFSPTGLTYTYKVEETAIDGYVTTYSNNSTVYDSSKYDDTNRFTITNTIEQEDIKLEGTKTWVDAADTDHVNADEITLIVTRSTDVSSIETLTNETYPGTKTDGTYIVVWSNSDNSYTIYWYYDTAAGEYVYLPKYDSAGYTYTYRVEEETVTGYDAPETEFDDSEAANNTYKFNFTNRQPSDEPEDPTKDVDVDTSDSKNYGDNGVTVSVGDIITYSISYYNNNNTEATVTITDVLDDGVDFDSASGNGSYNSAARTVTWTFTADPFEKGTVTLTVKVNENAKLTDAGDTDADIDNQATVAIADNTADTNIVTNPLEDDGPEDPTKAIIAVEDSEYAEQTEKDTEGNVIVAAGDYVTYHISYYNNLATEATITITDVLDEGVDLVWATQGSTYNEDTHTVTWTGTTPAFTYGTITICVQVNENAKTAAQTYTAVDPDDPTAEYDNYTYTNIASIANQASVTVGNQTTQYTEVVENPLDDDEPKDPTKEISASSPSGYYDEEGNAGVTTDADTGTQTGTSVGIGGLIEYDITYYNNYNRSVTVVITDTLDEGVNFRSASGTDVTGKTLTDEEKAQANFVTYELTTETVTAEDGTQYERVTKVTWTIYNATALAEGTVTLVVEVNENAKDVDENAGETEATVENDATVKIDTDNEAYTNLVVNPIDPDKPGDPDKVVSAGSAAGADGAAVKAGDEITYEISYYNHNNTAANATIVDVLDTGVDFVSASGTEVDTAEVQDNITEANYVTYNVSTTDGVTTVTWIIYNITPFTGDVVELTVQVNESARVVDADETEAGVDNQATLYMTDHEASTNIVTNPVEDDEPTDPTKDVTASTSATGTEQTDKSDAEETITYGSVSVGDQITYEITYYNNLNEAATVTIMDPLDAGVTFIEASDGGVYDADTHTVTWTLDADAFTAGYVTLTVEVNENAKTITEDETLATVENQASVQIGTGNAATTWTVIHPITPDDPEDPVKTEVIPGTGEESTVVSVDEADGTKTYEEVAVGSILVYDITYYNNNNCVADVVITDVLDPGVDFVSASDGGVYDAATHTVTWTFKNTAPFTGGSVVLEVEVNASAKDTDTDEDAATVENQATVTVGEVDNDTNIVVNPIADDDPEEPTKAVDANSEAGVEGDPASVGETITYVISYYNHESETVTVTITDALDEGVDFVSASDSGVYDEATHTVTWTITDVDAFTSDFVTLTVVVNENAKLIDDDEDAATVENTAFVQIGNNTATETNKIETPLDPEDPTDPEKTVTADSEAGVDGAAVDVGDAITYAITYYNHTNTAADVTITDVLDPGVAFVSASDGGVYDADTHTVTWTISGVTPYTGSFVTLTVEVTEDALKLDEGDTSLDVENQATVTVGDVSNDTDIVVNPIVPDEPAEPTKYVSDDSAAGSETVSTDEEGNVTYETVGIGDRITYAIEYYNHHNYTTTVEITDELDPGVDFISASDGGVYDEDTHTVTWTLSADAYTGGSVTLIVEVNEDAKLVETGETIATVENDAIVVLAADYDNAVTTNLVIHPVDPDDPVDPSKTIVSEAGAAGDAVAVGDEVTYEIVYYNYNNETADVIITDVLDPGVTFRSATGSAVYDEDTHTVTWTITGVDPYTTGSVTLTVEVNENAKLIDDDETQATIENTASVQIGNDAAVDTNTTENPVTPDDPVNPTKAITTDGVADGDEVAVGDELTYEITYYNHMNEVATVVITDALDEGTDFVSATDGGVYDADTHTVTWTLTVDPFTAGSVSVTVEVNESAETQVENTASVQIGNEDAVDTNTVENPIEEETPAVTPTEPVPTTGDTNAVVPYTIVMLLAFAAIVALLKGRRSEEQA